MPQSAQAAKTAIDALVQDIEGLVQRGGVRAEEAFALLHRAIDQPPAQNAPSRHSGDKPALHRA
ncbi:hypothetical protein BKE38_11215 [Pseudoroseomonas deserti]|uniref:Uncharacterized protein n=1 Tax=Teichococcus deserti TaxID=1817963 RepID=A0A1V2H2Y4_9PROT|nr:hypothetical protein [Pseudoroseomonas deserti]ONG54037.1 hypothetical protein BKE38_11215 [Pseudoroseomonas deserti]